MDGECEGIVYWYRTHNRFVGKILPNLAEKHPPTLLIRAMWSIRRCIDKPIGYPNIDRVIPFSTIVPSTSFPANPTYSTSYHLPPTTYRLPPTA